MKSSITWIQAFQNYSVCLAVLCLSSCVSNHPTCCTHGQVQVPCHDESSQSYREWAPDARTTLPCIAEQPKRGAHVKGVVVLAVGMDGTLGDYKSLTHALTQHGYAVYGSETRTMKYDSVKERRGRAVPWSQWPEDLRKFTETVVRKNHPHLPIYYHGHSFGAVVALEAIAEQTHSGTKSVDGLILQSPAYALLPAQNSCLANALLWSFGYLRMPHLGLMQSRKLEMVANPPGWTCAWMQSDDRVKKGYSLSWARQVLKMGNKARIFSETDLLPPTFALWGRNDFITLGGRLGDFYAQKQSDYVDYLNLKLAKKKAKVLPYDGCHLLTEGKDKEVAIRDIIKWLDAQKP